VTNPVFTSEPIGSLVRGSADNTSPFPLLSSATPGGLIPPSNGSWSAGTIFIDPLGVLATSSDGNDGRTRATALRTWRQYIQLLGTLTPYLQVNTTVTFLSSPNPANPDPVVCTPIVGPAQYVLQGDTPTLVNTIVLAAVTAKNRAAGTNSALQANLGASGAVGQLLINTTRGNSVAWVEKSLGGNVFQLSQPMTPQTPAAGFVNPPTEVDTWANGDSVQLTQPIAINLSVFRPTLQEFSTVLQPNYPALFQCNVADPNLFGSPCFVGQFTLLGQCGFTRFMIYDPSTETLNFNCLCQAGQVVLGGGVEFLGGGISGVGAGGVNILCGGVIIDADYIVGAPMTLSGSSIGNVAVAATIGTLFLDANLTIESGTVQLSLADYNVGVLYGSAGHNVFLLGNSRLANVTGHTFVQAFTAPALVAPGIVLNGNSTASSHTGASPDVLNSGISTTPAHLDSAAGVAGFGGTAFVLGGASVSNVA